MGRVPLPVAQLALSAMNHVLQQQPASRERMRAHAGRGIRLVAAHALGTWEAEARIGPDGLFTAAREAAPAVVLRFTPGVDAMFHFLGGGASAMRSHLAIEGDAALADAIGEVAEALQWDFEEDLSRVVGDPVAHRVGMTVRGVHSRLAGLRDRSREAVQRAASSREGPLVARPDLDGFVAEIGRLLQRVERLEGMDGAAPRR
jgi:ubiquinone biosynthesis protein UbiJ